MDRAVEYARQLVNCEGYATHRYVVAAVVGLYVGRVVLRGVLGLANSIRAFLLAPLGISRADIKKYGKWAVVTGASEGIGRGYALELARRGLDVVIMSRSREKLDKVAEEIRSKHSEREVRVFPVDFSKGGEIYPDIAEELKDLDIGVLVNNVGYTFKYPEEHAKIPAKSDHTLVELNIQTMLQMCRVVLPGMETRKRGAIVNISSGLHTVAMPMSVVYTASKVFVVSFSECLRKDYESKGIYIQVASPFAVATNMSLMDASLFVPDGTTYARSAVNTIGIQKVTFGHWSHAILGFLAGVMPSFILEPGLRQASKQHREHILRTMAKQQ